MGRTRASDASRSSGAGISAHRTSRLAVSTSCRIARLAFPERVRKGPPGAPQLALGNERVNAPPVIGVRDVPQAMEGSGEPRRHHLEALRGGQVCLHPAVNDELELAQHLLIF